jgi:hypothetical protein
MGQPYHRSHGLDLQRYSSTPSRSGSPPGSLSLEAFAS